MQEMRTWKIQAGAGRFFETGTSMAERKDVVIIQRCEIVPAHAVKETTIQNFFYSLQVRLGRGE